MLEKAEKEKKQKLSFRFVPTQRVIGNSKKIAKKLEQLNNTVMASFQAKIGWKWPRNNKNINYRSVPFLHNTYQKISKKQQKNSKN